MSIWFLQRLIDCRLVFGPTRALAIRNSSPIGKAAFPRHCMPVIRVLSSTWKLGGSTTESDLSFLARSPRLGCLSMFLFHLAAFSTLAPVITLANKPELRMYCNFDSRLIYDRAFTFSSRRLIAIIKSCYLHSHYLLFLYYSLIVSVIFSRFLKHSAISNLI